eukprot:2940725-Amphidinium_carterae.1
MCKQLSGDRIASRPRSRTCTLFRGYRGPSGAGWDEQSTKTSLEDPCKGSICTSPPANEGRLTELG